MLNSNAMEKYFTIYDKSGYYYNGSQRIGEVAFSIFQAAKRYATREQASRIMQKLSTTYPHTRLSVKQFYDTEAEQHKAFDRIVEVLKSRGGRVSITCKADVRGGKIHSVSYINDDKIHIGGTTSNSMFGENIERKHISNQSRVLLNIAKALKV